MDSEEQDSKILQIPLRQMRAITANNKKVLNTMKINLEESNLKVMGLEYKETLLDDVIKNRDIKIKSLQQETDKLKNTIIILEGKMIISEKDKNVINESTLIEDYASSVEKTRQKFMNERKSKLEEDIKKKYGM
jgi:hypothetical protein